MATKNDRAALIVVDMQEDFCPPNGSLAVQEGREIAPVINSLLTLPIFTTRVATQDYHPPEHISFAPNHPAPNNRPFGSSISMPNPAPGKENETKPQLLWPVHCVAGTEGASLIHELDRSRIDIFVKKGMDARVEMYSAFADAFGNLDASSVGASLSSSSSVDIDLKDVLRGKGVRDVYVVGLAGDYCVKWTAIDAAKAGFRSFVVEEGTRCVVPSGWEGIKRELRDAGVSVISAGGSELSSGL